MSNKKEFAIGEEIHYKDVVLVVEVSDDDKCCDGCYFNCASGLHSPYNCLHDYRTDGKDVIFKLKEE